MENKPLESHPENSATGRRSFLKLAAATGTLGAAALALKQVQIPSLDTGLAAEPGEEKIVKTACGLCPCGCGLDVRVVDGKAVKIEGNPLHPLNQGVCCLRAQASLEILYSPERIQHPRRQLGERGSGDWEEISWDEALSMVAGKLGELRADGQAHSVAFLHGELRGQMRGLVGRFMQAYGSPNVISQDSLGEGLARLTMLLTQGVNAYPVYDLNNANYVVAFGSNLLEASRHVIGYLGSLAFMRRGRPQRGKLVSVHPRMALTGVKADEWVPIRPGTYAALALGMANVIINSGLYDAEYLQNFTFGFQDFEDENGQTHKGFKSLVLEGYPLERVSDITGVTTDVIARLAGEFATNRPALAVMPTEPAELNAGNSLYTAMAIHALNALVGSLDGKGGVLVQRFPDLGEWPAYTADLLGNESIAQPRLDGAGSQQIPLAGSVYQEVARRILAEDPYPVNALFLLNANPVYEVPNQGEVSQALLKVPFVVSFASTLDESSAHADLILPASTFLEIWGDDFIEGTGFAGVTLRQPVVEPVHDTANPGDVLLQLAARLGGPLAQALPWSDYQMLVRERLSALELDWDKFLANGNWSEMVYFNAAPGSKAWEQVLGRDRLAAPKDGRFDFYSRELHAILGATRSELSADPAALDLACLPHFEAPAALEGDLDQSVEFPFLLISQGLLTHTRSWQGIIPTLQECYGLQTFVRWSSWVEINPETAAELDMADHDEVWVESPYGKLKTQVRLYPGIYPNVVFMPQGQGHFTQVAWGRHSEPGQIGVNANTLMRNTTEPLTGQAIFNPVRVKISKA